MQTIYIEKAIINNEHVDRILAKYKSATLIEISKYSEVFNRKNQNFRLQKQNPALIIANKPGKRVLPTPEGFGIGGVHNYYFSHLLNCPYDCRYCFLQGFYNSANYVWFVNYSDFCADILQTMHKYADIGSCFFSGYDADSLAFNPTTQFIETFVPFFYEHGPKYQAYLELRTKSANISALLKQPACENIIVAFSFTPQEISSKVEHKVPAVSKRIKAMATLANIGWPVGIRLDPLIYTADFNKNYDILLQTISEELNHKQLHSVSLGPLRFPDKMHKKIWALYPNDKLLNQRFVKDKGALSYPSNIEEKMQAYINNRLQHYQFTERVFNCYA